MKKYRIGDYAKYLGVTPDLLKYYEEMGIITSERSESGYRYYPFNVAPKLFECIRLRNYGMTLKDIKQMITGDIPEEFSWDEYLENDMKMMEEEIRFDQALIDNYQEYKEARALLGDKPNDWLVRNNDELLFLPHSNGHEFLDDPRIYEILKPWMEVIPIVRSATLTEADGTMKWGFVVKKRFLDALKLPINDVVVHFKPQKSFYYMFAGSSLAGLPMTPDQRDREPLDLMASMNLKSAYPYLRVVLMPTQWGKDLSKQYGYYCIPLA